MCVLRSESFPGERQERLKSQKGWSGKEEKWSELICRLPCPAANLCSYKSYALQAVLKFESDDRMSQNGGRVSMVI